MRDEALNGLRSHSKGHRGKVGWGRPGKDTVQNTTQSCGRRAATLSTGSEPVTDLLEAADAGLLDIDAGTALCGLDAGPDPDLLCPPCLKSRFSSILDFSRF
jgi:hypothetical protein